MTGAVLLILAWAGAIVWPVIVIGAIVMRWRDRAPSAGSWIAMSVLSPLWALGVWTFLVEPELLVVRHVDVSSKTWSGGDLRIGVISDIHAAGPHMSVGRLRGIVSRMNDEQVDIVVLLGDFVGGHAPVEERAASERDAVTDGLAPLARLDSSFGVYAVLGNHDWWYDGPAVEDALKVQAIPVLENSAIRVERPKGDFWVAGLADLFSDRVAEPSYGDALKGVREGEDVIVLSHWPDPFEAAPDRVALTLAGHTHCGQVNLPGLGRPILPSRGSRKWPCGLYEPDGRALYVTGGVGVSMLPVRFNQPPEIVVLTLRGADAEQGPEN